MIKKEKLHIIVRFLLILGITIWLNSFVFEQKIDINKFELINDSEGTYRKIGDFNLSKEEFNGDLNNFLWKIFSVNEGKDKFCVKNQAYLYYNDKKDSKSKLYTELSLNNESYIKIYNKKCFKLNPNSNKISFDLKYTYNFDISKLKEEKIYLNNAPFYQKKYSGEMMFTGGEVYLTSNFFHKVLRFILLFLAIGTLFWTISRTIYFIKYGLEK